MTFPALANDGSVVNLLTGAELQGLLQTIGNNAIAPASQPISGTVSVAGTVPVSGSFYPSTQPVSIAAPVSVTGTVSITGVATSALQTTGNGYLQSIVAAVQDTTPAAVTQSGTWSFGLAGTLPAFAATPTFNLGTLNGAATAAKQDTIAGINATIGTRAYGTPSARLTVGASDTASSGLAATEVLLHASTRCFVLAGAAATNAAIPLEAGEKFHMKLTSGQQIHVIQDSAGGFLNVVPVA